MLEAIKDIGNLKIKQGGKDPLEILLEDPNANGHYNKVAVIVLKEAEGIFEFIDVELEEYDSDKIFSYLFRRGSSAGSNYSLTALLTDDPSKTMKIKVLGWFSSLLKAKKLPLKNEEINYLKQLQKCLDDEKTSIISKINNIKSQIGKEGLVITLKIRTKEKDLYIGEISLFRQLLRYLINKKDEKISSSDKVCSLCGEIKENVVGNLSTYTFYTLDKPGFITGGFNDNDAWKNFPVCTDCKLELEEGKKYVQSNLAFRFCGLKYFLIPKFLWGKEETLDEVFEILEDTTKKISLKQKDINSIIDDEEEVLDAIKEVNDNVTLYFLFIHKFNSAERIRLLIEDVFPSHVRTIFNSKRWVDEKFETPFHFKTIRSFFMKSDPNNKNNDLDKYFLEIINRIFKLKKIQIEFLVKFLMKKIRTAWIKDSYFHISVQDAMKVLLFMEHLNLIDMEVKKMESKEFDIIFERYGCQFQTPLKRGLLLLGTLTELLLRKQYSERSAKPFMKQLKNFKMAEKDFKGLLPKVQNKLEEYDSFDMGKRRIAKEAADYLLQSEGNWKLSLDEMNFYFCAGMNLVDEVCNIVYVKTDKSN